MDEILNCQIQSKRHHIRKTVHPCLGDVSYMQYLDNYLSGYSIENPRSVCRGEKKKKGGRKKSGITTQMYM